MRISDWSSDVCSSDLPVEPAPSGAAVEPVTAAVEAPQAETAPVEAVSSDESATAPIDAPAVSSVESATAPIDAPVEPNPPAVPADVALAEASDAAPNRKSTRLNSSH